MPKWGDEWGELWGGAISPIETHKEDAQARLLYQFVDATNLISLVCDLAVRAQPIENALNDFIALHDIPTAYGFLLDDLGELLGTPRQGFGDEDFRLRLLVTAQILLPSRRTVTGLLTMVRTLVDDPAKNIDLTELYPKAFILEVEDLTFDEASLLAPFISKAKPATYNGTFLVVPVDAFGFDDSTATVVTTTFGFGDSTATIVAGGPFAGIFPL